MKMGGAFKVRKKLIYISILLFGFIGSYFIINMNGLSLNSDEKNISVDAIEPNGLVSSTNSPIKSENLNEIVLKGLEELYSVKPTDLKITEVLNIEDSTFATFTFEKERYYGVLYSKKNQDMYLMGDIDINKTFKSEKMNVSQLIGDTNEDVKRKYRIISGIINDEMDSVNILYPNGEFIIIKLDNNQKTFMNVNVGYDDPPVKIIGLLKDKEVFQIEY